MDKLIFEWLQSHHTSFLNQNMLNITAMGSTTILVLLLLAGLSYTGFILKDWKQALYGGICVLLSLGTVEIGKYAIQRERPIAHDKVISTPNSPSMPSGHSAMSMSVLGILALMVQKSRFWVIVSILASLLIGFSRIYLGVHWFTDVLVGWFIGAVYFYIFYSLAINNRYARVQAMD
jgi:undecaprenyl-diphosphatase